MTTLPEPTETEKYKSFYAEMWHRRKEFDESWWLPTNKYPVKAALDALKQAGKLLEVLLKYDGLTPEAVGFTSRKVGNLIKQLENLKEKLDNKA